MHSDWFNGIEILQGRWQHGEKVGYCYPSGLEKTICKWDIHVPLVTKGLMQQAIIQGIMRLVQVKWNIQDKFCSRTQDNWAYISS
jgi:hypothetical protein